jgi:hypothetical protein
MLGVFREYRTALLTVSLLIALYKCIELMIPVLAARVINALEAHRPTSEIWVMAVTAFVVWVVHGNLLAYLVDRIEVKCFSFPAGVVNLLPVDMIHAHEGARLAEASRLCGGGKARDVLPGVESLPQLLTVCGGGEEVTSRAEVLRDGTIGREEALGVPR